MRLPVLYRIPLILMQKFAPVNSLTRSQQGERTKMRESCGGVRASPEAAGFVETGIRRTTCARGTMGKKCPRDKKGHLTAAPFAHYVVSGKTG